MGQRNVWAGLDIGGTKTAVLLTDQDGRVLGRDTRPTEVSDDPARLVSGIAAAVRHTMHAAGLAAQDLRAVGGGVPGMVEVETGVVRLAVNLRLRAYPLGAALAAELDVPVTLENDVRVAAQGAYEWLGGRTALHNMAYLSLGTGIAAGLVLDGRLYRGSHGMAGEIGHIIVAPDGPRCSCGLRGCLEAVAAGPAIGRAWPDGDGTAQAVFAAAQRGEETAVAVIAQVANYLARAVHLLAMTVDVQAVALGGGVAHAGPPLLEPLEAELARLRAASPLAQIMLPPDFVRPVPAAADVACRGAVALARAA